MAHTLLPAFSKASGFRPIRRLRRASLVALTTLLPWAAQAQLGYSIADAQVLTGTYTDLATTGTAISVSNPDDGNSVAQAIGFTFNYNGQAFTQFVLNTNGFIKLGSTAPSAPNLFLQDNTNQYIGGPLSSTDPADDNIIAPFNADLQPSGTADFRRITTGTAPNRVCTIQWKNVADKITPPIPYIGSAAFQVKLYEGSNRIEFVYGPWTPSGTFDTFRASVVGLKGSTDFLTVWKLSADPASNAQFDDTNYLGVSLGVHFNYRPTTLPASGQIYRFDTPVTNPCPQPTAFTLGTVGATTAAFTYGAATGAVGYTLIYGPVGFDPTLTGTSVNVAGTSPSLTSLTSLTAYDVYVRTRCAGSSTSNLVGPLTFSTTCVAPTITLPYVENFDAVPTGPVLPCGWSQINADGDTTRWRVSSAAPSSAPNSLVIRWTEPGIQQNDWVVTPGIPLTAGQRVELSFRYRAGTASFPNNIEVKVGTAATVAGLVTQIFQDAGYSGTNYRDGFGTFTATTAGTYFFGFHAFSDPDQERTWIDDVRIEAAPACGTPRLLTATTTSNTTATVTFTPRAGTSSFQVIYGPVGFNPVTGGTTVTAGASPVNLTGLAPLSSYQVYVRATCGAAGSSALAGPVAFSTCGTGPRTLPYFENFDNSGSALPCGWTQQNLDGDDDTDFQRPLLRRRCLAPRHRHVYGHHGGHVFLRLPRLFGRRPGADVD